jgi:ATP synthase protein I
VGKFKEFVERSSAFTAGLEFSFAVLIGTAIGYFIDSKLKTFPVFTFIWLVIGFVAGARNLYRRLKKIAE